MHFKAKYIISGPMGFGSLSKKKRSNYDIRSTNICVQIGEPLLNLLYICYIRHCMKKIDSKTHWIYCNHIDIDLVNHLFLEGYTLYFYLNGLTCFATTLKTVDLIPKEKVVRLLDVYESDRQFASRSWKVWF